MAVISSTGTTLTGAGTVIGEITAISFAGVSATEIDVSNLASYDKTFILGTVDGGTVEITVNAIGTAPSVLNAGSATPTVWAIRFGGVGVGYSVGFSAYIQGVKAEAGVDQVVKTTYTLQISSLVVMS
jgi:phage head maturation protease